MKISPVSALLILGMILAALLFWWGENFATSGWSLGLVAWLLVSCASFVLFCIVAHHLTEKRK
jgi:hypothetical protein